MYSNDDDRFDRYSYVALGRLTTSLSALSANILHEGYVYVKGEYQRILHKKHNLRRDNKVNINKVWSDCET